MEIMKPGKKEGKPNCDEDVFLERILQTTKIQLSVLSEWMQLWYKPKWETNDRISSSSTYSSSQVH